MRIRCVKPEFFISESTSTISPEAVVLFLALIVQADDHGNLRISSKQLFGFAYHSRRRFGIEATCPYTNADIIEMMDELIDAKLVELYDDNGTKLGHLRGWQQHQRIDNAGAPRVALPPGWRLETTKVAGKLRYRSVPPAGSPVDYPDNDLGSLVTASGGEIPPEVAAGGGGRITISDHDHDHDQDPEVTRTYPGQSEIFEELTASHDLWPEQGLWEAAGRIARALTMEDKAKGIPASLVGLRCTQAARTHKARYPLADSEQLLARAEAQVGYLLQDVRLGKWKPPEKAPGSPDREIYEDMQASAKRVDAEQAKRAAKAEARKPGEGKALADMIKTLPFMKRPKGEEHGLGPE